MDTKPHANYTSPTGAVRASAHSGEVRYDLLLSNDVAMRRLAETFAEGFKKYGPDNWKRGFPVSELWAHMFIHLLKWIAGDKSEDHLAHACWNLMAIMWQEENKPELQDFPRRPEIAPLQTVVNQVPPLGACPLYVGTPQEGLQWHETLVYDGGTIWAKGRCKHCSNPMHMHFGYPRNPMGCPGYVANDKGILFDDKLVCGYCGHPQQKH